MRLHEDTALFKDAISITAQRLNLPEIYVEKDYWVTFALHRIFTSPVANLTVFKGGTALAKCFSFIQRFSEDIDLVVLQGPHDTANQLKQRLKQVTQAVTDVMPEIEQDGLTNKKGMIRKTAHSYTRQFDGQFGQVRDLIILEVSWLGSAEPCTTGRITSFVYDMMLASGQQNMAEDYGLLPFDVAVLDPTRTLCEKIMSLVRFSYTPTPMEDLKKKIRHVYDLHQLLQQDDLTAFFNSIDFDLMLRKVVADDKVSFKSNNDWLQYHPSEALIFTDVAPVWRELRSTYNGGFKNLVFGALPNEEHILATLRNIRSRLAQVEWIMP
ncbi:nucleotidyl transferase AbiEii/AbiGii toxin family protein [uncultured Fibrella sp.]|uniref:nucleotidyl transferase AbiEii/AbiGii toxin family protein n=1 Tax=uncultured Fibrella sp. TaxID=1284596 RepID=UPI0035CC4A59